MKAIILAGGFAKRMWPLTENRAKALLPIAGKPIIEHILKKFEHISAIHDLYVSTNKKFENDFKRWIARVKTTKNLSLIVEPHNREENKMGAIGGLKFFIDTCKIDDDLLVIAGDNLFEFDIDELLDFNTMTTDSVVALYDIADIETVRKRFGVAVVNEKGNIVAFEEKPAEPSSTLISTGIYVFKRADLQLIHAYLDEKMNPDAPGFFIKWLTAKRTVKGFIFTGYWFDIGSFKLYADANTTFKHEKKGRFSWHLKRHDVRWTLPQA
nr:nucleotidyltransferase family protein [Candidatus Sigynarchaeota archaeon]